MIFVSSFELGHFFSIIYYSKKLQCSSRVLWLILTFFSICVLIIYQHRNDICTISSIFWWCWLTGHRVQAKSYYLRKYKYIIVQNRSLFREIFWPILLGTKFSSAKIGIFGILPCLKAKEKTFLSAMSLTLAFLRIEISSSLPKAWIHFNFKNNVNFC